MAATLTNSVPLDFLQTTIDHEWLTQLQLARATLAVDQLGEFPGFHPVSLGDALDRLKTEFIKAHTARLDAQGHK